MRLKNKKTGEIIDDVQYRNYSLSDGFGFRMNGKEWEYHSLAELNEEWEDAPEEPKEYWAIDCFSPDGELISQFDKCSERIIENRKRIGNYFETKEEAEKAVEKLKAWKRLKEVGFVFCGKGDCLDTIKFDYGPAGYNNQDFNLLFGGEE